MQDSTTQPADQAEQRDPGHLASVPEHLTHDAAMSDPKHQTHDAAKSAERTTVMIRTGAKGRLPVYATVGSAGCDLYAATTITLFPGETKLLPLDLVMALEPGVEAQIRPRSGLSLKTDLRVPNAPGTIDSDYRSEVGIILQNTFSQADLPVHLAGNPDLADRFSRTAKRTTLADYQKNTRISVYVLDQFPELGAQIIYLDAKGNPWGTITIEPGERIAQMVFSRHLQADFIEHPNPSAVGMDRGGGFGSTGTK